MKINYVPGLPLRLFPQTSRDPYVAFKNFTQPECDLVLMTGNCPDTDTLWNITNLEDFLSNKQDKIVYREKHSVQFSYDGNKQKRIIHIKSVWLYYFTCVACVFVGAISFQVFTNADMDTVIGSG